MMIRALIVDDDELIRDAIVTFAADEGMKTVTADGGFMAIHALKRMRFDAVVLDLQMPHGSGREVLDFIEQSKLDLPVFVMSGDVGLLEDIRSPLIEAAFRKPFAIGLLMAKIVEAVSKKKAVRSHA